MKRHNAKLLSLSGIAFVFFYVVLVARSYAVDYRRAISAGYEIPAARAWLDSNPDYEHLDVGIGETSDTGPGLYFSGSLGTTAQVIRFDRAARTRFGGNDFAVISVVLSRFEDEPSEN
ncbi:MAG: hypothetical protein AAGI68_02100 [Planctomycetota bacterium]